jgi:RNA polymerase sigma-70 factor (ECF subfamily)
MLLCDHGYDMGATTGNSSETGKLLRLAAGGDKQAPAQLFARYRERLRRMVRLRLDRRLRGRLDSSGVLREAFLDVSRRLPEYTARPAMPFFLWVREVTGQRLQSLHQQYLGPQVWDAGQDLSLYRGSLPHASCNALAAQLLGKTPLGHAATARAEMQLWLQEALNGMDPLDREVLALRHFEELSNREAAQALGIEEGKASHHYIWALKRLKEILNSRPGFFDQPHP